MNKYALCAVLCVGSACAALRVMDDSSSKPAGAPTMLSDDEKVRAMLASYRSFKGALQSTIDSLRRGELRLPEAHAAVREAAGRDFPRYLTLLAVAEAGQSVEERLARNLVGHVRSVEQLWPSDPSPLPALEKELCELLQALESRPAEREAELEKILTTEAQRHRDERDR